MSTQGLEIKSSVASCIITLWSRSYMILEGVAPFKSIIVLPVSTFVLVCCSDD